MATKAGPKRTTKRPASRSRSRKAEAAKVVELRGSLAHPAPWGATWSSHVSPDVAARVTSIFGVVRWIAQAVAVCPLQLMRELPSGRRERAVLPAAYTLRKRPNAWQSAFDFYGLQAYWTALHGNGYARIVSGDRPWFDEGDPRRRGGWCSQLLPMHPSRVKVEQLNDYTLEYQFQNARGDWERLAQDQVLHWRWISDNGIVGHAPAEMCSTSINLARKLDIAATAFWDNSARPDMVMETDQRIPDEAVAAMRATIRDAYGGAKNRGAVAMLPPGVRMKAMESNSMEASQFSELRAEILPEVCRHWGVPSTLLGDARMAKYSTVEQEHLSAQVWCLLPWARRMESPIDMAVQRVHGEEFYCKLDTRGVLRGDASSRAALYQALWAMGAISPNEIRDREDLDLIDDPAADLTYLQLGFSTLAAAAAQGQAGGGQPQPANGAANNGNA